MQPTYYEILNISKSASDDEIRKQYHKLCRQHHPDKTNPALLNHSPYDFLTIQNAYQVLGDSINRKRYDIENGFENSNDHSNETFLDEIRDKSRKSINNMASEYHLKLNQELRKNGLVILKALFGNLSVKDDMIPLLLTLQNISEDLMMGPIMEVTVPLQCMVEDSTLILDRKYFTVNPNIYRFIQLKCQNDNISLYVQYSFKDVLHEFTASINSRIAAPQSVHRILLGIPRGPVDSASLSKFDTYIKMNHAPRWRRSTLLLLSIGISSILTMLFLRYKTRKSCL